MNTSLTLSCGGRTVARYTYLPTTATALSPRPYLHPVTTLGGTPVTEELPDDHRHHLGAGVAVPDVGGHNFWGGRTFVRGRGAVEMDNHGAQTHIEFKLSDTDGFVEELSWRADGVELLRELRTVAVTGLTASAYALDFTSVLTNTGGADLAIGSPATNGRPGAAYGGFFWRAPKERAAPEVFGEELDSEHSEHTEHTLNGSRRAWLALAGDGWTLVFAGATARTREDPWFVRSGDYPGVGSSLAHSEPLPVAAGASVVRRVVTVVADGRPGRAEAAALVRKAVTS
ncbi:MAG TPA: PmoA family protein [Streptomyces sp.]|nr:PmoA family protein [Streptomyces sp.]